MHATNQIYDKLKEKGYPVSRGALYALAKDLVAKAPRRDPDAALAPFLDAVQRRDELLVGFLRECALAYLRMVKDDLAGTAVAKPAAAGGGHSWADIHDTSAPATPTGIGGDVDAAGTGQNVADTQSADARPAALRHGTPSTTAGGGHADRDTHQRPASPTSPDTGKPVHVHEHWRAEPGRAGTPDIGIEKPSRLVMKPANKPHVSREVRFASWRSTTAGALAILGGIMVNNRPLAHVTVGEARKWAEKHRINGEEFMAKGRAFALEAAKVEALTHGMPDNEVVGNYAKFFSDEEALRRLNAVEDASAA